MQRYWVNFATSGDPNGSDLPSGRRSMRRRSKPWCWTMPLARARSRCRTAGSQLHALDQYFSWRRENAARVAHARWCARPVFSGSASADGTTSPGARLLSARCRPKSKLEYASRPLVVTSIEIVLARSMACRIPPYSPSGTTPPPRTSCSRSRRHALSCSVRTSRAPERPWSDSWPAASRSLNRNWARSCLATGRNEKKRRKRNSIRSWDHYQPPRDPRWRLQRCAGCYSVGASRIGISTGDRTSIRRRGGIRG